ncbi:hypothetical protein A2Y83_01185 [Candidatus Falkowbacteria bacterium RBG_13_39_14]|uniref:DUF5667 domain-containing protein n=1 Tax=Candidatus Falkowbacteria bacterium RBG_13_39_14 TaxID=1797985 RepID=A0A1F5S7F5_9BACT|nr:MAG: hypothetical protein A2Y83_01185 [Candidatus Falkowbacteria bacterium RBG_13_39_14]
MMLCVSAVRAQEESSNGTSPLEETQARETSIETAPEEANMLIAPAPETEESAYSNESEPVQNEPVAESSSADTSADAEDASETAANAIPETSEEVGEAAEEMESDKEAQAIAEEDVDVTAEDLGISEPTILPDSGLYAFKNMWRGVKTAFTFNPVKKAELKLEIANEKLIEAKKIAEKTGSEEFIEKAIENYKEAVETVKEKVENIKEKAQENPRVDKFLDKLADHQIKQTKLLDKLEEKLPEKVFAKVKEAKERVIENLGNAITKLEDRKEKIAERIETAIENQKGSEFKTFKNIEILKELEEKIPEEAKFAIREARERKIEHFKEKMEEIKDDPEKVEKFKKYMGAIPGNQARHLEILNEIKGDDMADAGIIDMIEDAKEKPMLKLRHKLETLPDEEAREKFLGHLQDGEMKNLEVMKEIENSLPPETQEKIKTLKEKAFKVFEDKMKDIIQDPEKRKEFFENMPPPPIEQLQVMDEMREFATPENLEMLQEIKEKAMDKFKEKMELMKDDPEKQGAFMQKMMGAGYGKEPIMEVNMERLRALKDMENNMPEEFKKHLEPIKAAAMEEFKNKIEQFDENPEKKEMFMEGMRNDARHFEIMEELEENMDPEKRRMIDEMREKAFMDINGQFEKLNGHNPEEKEAFLHRIAGDDPQQIRVLERVREKLNGQLPGNAQADDVIGEVMEKQIERMEDKAKFMEDPDRLEEFKKNMNSWGIKQKLQKTEYFDSENFIKGMDARIENAKENHEIKMENMKVMEQKRMEEKNRMRNEMPQMDQKMHEANERIRNSGGQPEPARQPGKNIFDKQRENFDFKKPEEEIGLPKKDKSEYNMAPPVSESQTIQPKPVIDTPEAARQILPEPMKNMPQPEARMTEPKKIEPQIQRGVPMRNEPPKPEPQIQHEPMRNEPPKPIGDMPKPSPDGTMPQ